MRHLKQSEFNCISGGGLDIESTFTNPDNMYAISKGTGIVAGLVFGALRGNEQHRVGHVIVGAVLGYVAGIIGYKALEGGIVTDYIKGDFCSLGKKLWPYHGNARRS